MEIIKLVEKLPDDIILHIYTKCLKRYRIYNGTLIKLHRPKRKMRQTFYKKIKNRSVNLFGDINALLKSIILFDDYSD